MRALRDVAAVAFDLDGTLVDSAPDIAQALNTALARAGLRGFDLGAIRSWVGDGPDVLIDRALTKQGVDGADGSLHTRIRTDFDAATLAAPLDRGEVYPGIVETLGRLHDALPLTVVTNKPTALARAVLEDPLVKRPLALEELAGTRSRWAPTGGRGTLVLISP